MAGEWQMTGLFWGLTVYSVLHHYNTADDSQMIYNVNLPPEHMPFYFNNHPEAAAACRSSEYCPYKKYLDKKACWGYEKNCSLEHKYSNPVCDGKSRGWVKTKEEQQKTFFKQGDFGYIRDRQEELIMLCKPEHPDDTFLECAKYTRFCRARNIMFDFSSLLTIPEPMRYREDVIREGQVGGYCKLNKEALHEQGQHKSPLQSWYAELEHFTEFSYHPIKDKKCDSVISRQAFIMKLDATVNMYHHFCDFLNLYATLHLNDTFTTDISILIWDTVSYHSNFNAVWHAFTKYPLLNLGQFKGKKVCFKDVVFPLLPRMIFGMYYNMPLIPGCINSGLFHAFSSHILHKLNIKQESNPGGNIRVTLISRSTQYRRILNEDELIRAMKTVPDIIPQKINFNRQMPFIDQLKTSHNTDILIGIHGAGLTQMLFMPVWGVVFEIYNCEDENCYADLARLRGLKYITWEKKEKLLPEDEGHHPTLGAHAKFTNYGFDVEEFMNLVQNAADHVRKHPAFLNFHKASLRAKSYIHDEF